MNKKLYKFAFVFFIIMTVLFLLFSIPMAAVSFGAFLFAFVLAIITLVVAMLCRKQFKEKKTNIRVASAITLTNYVTSSIKESSESNTVAKIERFSLSNNISAGQFVVLDFETTGFSPESDHIIQIGAMKYNNTDVIDTFSTYVRPPIAIPHHISNITGINDLTVAEAPVLKDVLPKLVEFISNLDIVCHNASFDISFLNSSLSKNDMQEIQNNVFDTLKMSRKCIYSENHKLETLKRHFNLNNLSHDALEDCKTTAFIYLYCLDKGIKPDSINYNIKKEVQGNTINREPYLPTEIESSFYSAIVDFYKKENKNTTFLGYRKTGSYFDICYERFSILRLKLNGKLRYLLIRSTLEDFKSEYGEHFECDLGSKSESNHIRIFIKSPEDLLSLNKILLSEYDQTVKSYNNYLKYKNSPKESYVISINLSDYIK